MAKTLSIEQALDAIRVIRDAPEGHDLRGELAPFLKHRSNHVAAAAASTAEQLEAGALGQDLVDAFRELMRNPAKRDKGCEALTAIARSLVAMDVAAAKAYFAGIRHVQMEASFGPPVDAAAVLRGICARGLARMGHPEGLLECVHLLADKEVAARIGAIRAIADSGDDAGVLVLRLKALLGDKEDEVLGECFAGLLRLAPARSVEFVAQFVRTGSDEASERAALALGESRLPAALGVLCESWEQSAEAARKRTLLFSIAMLRLDEAVEFLLARVAEDSERAAADALLALALYARDETVRKRVEQIVARRGCESLRILFEREFR